MSHATQMTTSEARMLVLKKLYKGYQRHGHHNDYFPAQLIMNEITSRTKRSVDTDIVEGAVDSLLHEKLLDGIPDLNHNLAVRISEKGKAHLDNTLRQRRTLLIAYTGAVSGLASLLWDIFKQLLGS